MVEGPTTAQRLSIGAATEPTRLVVKFLALSVMAAVLPVLLVLTVPDGNDFAAATVDKHARLAMIVPAKIVLIGGSNVAYGVDSDLIERAFAMPTVNMSLTSNVGVRFMLEETRPDLKSGDIVVLSFEYDLYFRPPDGYNVDQFAYVKARPASLGFMTNRERLALIPAIPHAAQQKILRLFRQAAGRENQTLVMMRQVENRAGFDERGDLISHLELSWPYKFEDGIDLTGQQVNRDTVRVVADFARDMTARGVRVVLLPPPTSARYHQAQKARIDTLQASLAAVPGLEGLTSPERYVFSDASFFDSTYHLNAVGRRLRVQRIIEDLVPLLSD